MRGMALDDVRRLCDPDDKVRQVMKEQPNIGRAEMEILRYVAENHPVTVREVADHVAETKGHVRTTVLNVMERLRKKRFLQRKKVEGLYKYSPTLAPTDLLRNLVRDFVQKTLGGSVSPFVAFLTEEAKLNAREIAELKNLVRELETEGEK
jgi:predicted transcriptional regulator